MLPSASEYLLKAQTKNKLESSFQDSFCVLTEEEVICHMFLEVLVKFSSYLADSLPQTST